MKHKYHQLAILIVQLVHLFDTYPLLSQKKIVAEKFDWTEFVQYRLKQKCLQIVHDGRPELPVLATNTTLVYIRSPMSLKFRDISKEKEGQCETFLIFTENIEMVNHMLQFNHQGNVTQFFPFTNIYFHLNNGPNYTTNVEAMSLVRQFLIDNAVFGYMFEYNYNGNESNNVVISDLLRNDEKREQTSHIPNELSHPLVDTNLVKNNFRISLFNCTPYTIYPQHENENEEAFVNAMDGIEFRFVREVTKNWKKTFKFRDFSRVKTNPYVAVLDDLANKSSDLSMCALWIIEDIYKHYDLSTFYVKQCVMFLVPKPLKLHEASAIYTTFDSYVWLLFLFAFILSIATLNNTAKLEKSLNDSDSVYTDLTVTVLETVNAATGHAVTYFPSNQISVKIVLISWILVSSWLGISYTTIYASRLTSPSYEKPINTVRDMLDKGLSICNTYFDVSTMEPLSESVNPDHREMAKRSIVYGENAQYRRRVFVERKCAVIEVLLTKNYVSLLKFKDDLDLLSLFRPTKHCTYNHYTGFVFPKNSPYTKLFDWHIRRYQESGITQKWNSEILQHSQQMKILFDDYPELDESHHSIKLINVSGAFFLLGTGLSLSLVAFFVELLKQRRRISLLCKFR